MEIKSYRVVWEIDVDAINPREAALEAIDCIESGQAKVFEVYEWTGPAIAEPVATVDLSPQPDEDIELMMPIKRNF